MDSINLDYIKSFQDPKTQKLYGETLMTFYQKNELYINVGDTPGKTKKIIKTLKDKLFEVIILLLLALGFITVIYIIKNILPIYKKDNFTYYFFALLFFKNSFYFLFLLIFNIIFHEILHKLFGGKGEIINNERYIPQGINPWNKMKIAFLAPFRLELLLLVIFLLINILEICLNNQINLINVQIILIGFFIEYLFVFATCYRDLKLVNEIKKIIDENNFSKQTIYLSFYTVENSENESQIMINIYIKSYIPKLDEE